MRILTPTFVARYRNRVINIHHSFLPASSAPSRTIKLISAA
jgi:formyltetrahydrofolate hydrolase